MMKVARSRGSTRASTPDVDQGAIFGRLSVARLRPDMKGPITVPPQHCSAPRAREPRHLASRQRPHRVQVGR
jgi:hypothetical protein